MDLSAIPPQFQILAVLGFGAAIGIWAIFNYVKNRNNPDATLAPDQLRILGAALGDSQALDRLREEIRELRASVEDAARNTVKSNELMAGLVEATKDVAAAIRAKTRGRGSSI